MIRPASEPARVLVADDHAINLRLTRRLLELEGHAVRTVSNGISALDVACEEQPDLILADLYLPGLTGLELARTLKADPTTCDLRIVAFTAAAMVSDREAALEAGFDGHLAKPISRPQFSRFVSSQLDDVRLGAVG